MQLPLRIYELNHNCLKNNNYAADLLEHRAMNQRAILFGT